MNRCEAEIDEIRLKLYKETKDMTMEEQIKRLNHKGHELALQYGFKTRRSRNSIPATMPATAPNIPDAIP